MERVDIEKICPAPLRVKLSLGQDKELLGISQNEKTPRRKKERA